MYINFNKTLKKVIIVFLLITLTYSNFVLVGSNIIKGLISCALDEPETIEDKVILEQELITNKVYEIEGKEKRIIQIALKSGIIEREYPIKKTQIKFNTNLFDENLEKIEVKYNNKISFTDGSFNVDEDNNKLSILLENTNEEQTEKLEGLDELVITYVFEYNEETNVDEITSIINKMEIELFTGEKITVENKKDVFEVKEEFGEAVKVELKVEDLYKEDIKENKLQYNEELYFEFNYTEDFKEIIIEDNSIQTGTEEIIELNSEYQNITIDKDVLLEILGDKGTLLIRDITNDKVMTEINKEILQEESVEQFFNDENQIELEGEKRSEITMDEKNIVISYENNPEKISVKFYNLEEENKINNATLKLQISKTLKNIENIENLITNKKIIINNEENEYSKETKINNKITNLEFAINKANITTAQENNLTFTITLRTEGRGDKLYNNPEFNIELPEYIESSNISNAILVNNNIGDFTIQTQKINERNIKIKLIGNQKVNTTTEAENIQVVLDIALKTSKFLPTTDTQIKLTYNNEEESGEKVLPISLVTDEEFITAITVNSGESVVTSYRNSSETIKVEEQVESLGVVNTIVNNKEDMKNIIVLGHDANLGKIQLDNATIYYSENENATTDVLNEENKWQVEYTENAKSYLIVIQNMKKSEIINFGYSMELSKDIEEDTKYNVDFTIYNNETIKLAKTSLNVEQDTNKDDIEIKESSTNKIKATVETKLIDEKYNVENLEEAEIGGYVKYIVTLQNISNEKIENINMTLKLSEMLGNYGYNAFDQEDNLLETNAETNNNECTFSNINIEKDGTYVLVFLGEVEKYIEDNIKTKVIINYEEEEIKLFKIDKVEEAVAVNIDVESNKENEKLKLGDKITYTFSIENIGKLDTAFLITPQYTENALIIENVVITVTKDEEIVAQSNNIEEYTNLAQGEKAKIEIQAKVNEEFEKNKIVFYSNILVSKSPTYSTKFFINEVDVIKDEIPGENEGDETPKEDEGDETPGTSGDNDTSGEDGDNETPGTSGDNNTSGEDGDNEIPGTSGDNNASGEDGNNGTSGKEEGNDNNEEVKKYSISGKAWLDENNNGKRDSEEQLLAGIKVILIKVDTNKEIAEQTTDTKGAYKFTELEKGTYIVKFEYDTNKYSLTKKLEEIDENVNSDAILTTQNNKNIIKTDSLIIEDKNLENIDIGLILNKKFNLEINKYITKVTAVKTEGIDIYEYNNSSFAKVEIPRKEFNGATVIIEYNIVITNNGEVPAYVKTIEDILPEDLTFASELNNNWYRDDNGNLYCVELGAEEIKPGETKEITLVASKELLNEAITITNKVEITEVYNEYILEEENKEDNKSEATLIISVKTGIATKYIILSITCITIIVVGIYVINKKILLK